MLTGAIVRMPAEDLVEMLAVAGFDFVLLDCEHGPADAGDVRRHVTVADAHGVHVLVRIGENDPGLAARCLDQGAAGIVVPHVDGKADAEAAVRAAHYPPLGQRGFATYTRAGSFGTVEPRAHQARLAEETLVIGMIESPTGVREVASTLAAHGLDGYLVGPADLTAASGPGDPDLTTQVTAVHAAGRAAGAIRADIVSTPADAAAARAEGCTLVVYNLTAVLMSTFRELLRG